MSIETQNTAQNPEDLFDNYKDLIPGHLYCFGPSVYDQILNDLQEEACQFSKDELKNIIYCFNWISIYRTCDKEGLDSKVPFSNDDAFQIINLINSKLDFLPNQEKEEVRLENLLFCADLSHFSKDSTQHNFFVEQLFLHYEDMEEVVNSLSGGSLERLLLILKDFNGATDYIARDLIAKLYEMLSKDDLYRKHLDFKEVFREHFLRWLPFLVIGNDIGEEALLKRAQQEFKETGNHFAFDIISERMKFWKELVKNNPQGMEMNTDVPF